MFDGIVEKGKGIYNKIMDVFRDDDQYAQDMIKGLQEDEMERLLAIEALKDEDSQDGFQGFEDESLDETKIRISDAIIEGKLIKIGYFTYKGNIYIERIIKPEYIYYAKTTQNNVLVSWCYDWNDYRAFIIDNIVLVQDVKE